MSTGTELYAAHTKVYPKKVAGRFRRLKWAVLATLLGVYYAAPWLRWDRGAGTPDQAILVDMPGRRAYFFAVEIWPEEIYYLAGLLILAAVALFLVTSYAGRLWCGYACPQTVWTDLFLWAERLFEGDRSARMRRDARPLDFDKAWRKLAKHAAWIAIAFFTGGVWIAYFKDAPTLVREFVAGEASLAVYGFTALFTATTYLLAGWAREQVCTYMCPWPRFQAAMFDEDTFTVTYRRWRGEPRGKKPRAEAGWEGRGDCIDCRACVQVCPTGIDIRDGVQMECIDCGLCIDACDDIMRRIGRPEGLIAFDTEAREHAALEGRAPPPYRPVRLRPVFYTMLLAGIAGLMALQLVTRENFSLSVLRDRGALFVQLSGGDIRNSYTVKIHNKEHRVRRFSLSLREAPAGAEVGAAVLEADPDAITAHRIRVRAPLDSLDGASAPLVFELTDPDSGESATYRGVFWGPGS